MSEKCEACHEPVGTDRALFPNHGVIYHGYCWNKIQSNKERGSCAHVFAPLSTTRVERGVSITTTIVPNYCPRCGSDLQ